ncbi:MAG: integration host factor subunit beta [Thiobacillaceae bacterium]
MTRSKLIARLAARYPNLTSDDVEVTVIEILNAMKRSLSQGKRVEIRGFGVFTLNARRSRIGRNPKTGEAVQISAKKNPHFKPGKELRERVDHAAAMAPLHVP